MLRTEYKVAQTALQTPFMKPREGSDSVCVPLTGTLEAKKKNAIAYASFLPAE